jgi:hypothetical protein
MMIIPLFYVMAVLTEVLEWIYTLKTVIGGPELSLQSADSSSTDCGSFLSTVFKSYFENSLPVFSHRRCLFPVFASAAILFRIALNALLGAKAVKY